MRLPVKLNPTPLPRLVRAACGRLVAAGDPTDIKRIAGQFTVAKSAAEQRQLSLRFARAVSTLKFGETFKTTAPDRLALSNALIDRSLQNNHHVVVDAGVSDGSTSVDLAEVLGGRFDRLVAMDLHDHAEVSSNSHGSAFYDAKGTPLLAVSRWLICYADTAGADPVTRALAHRKFASAATTRDREQWSLINPRFGEMARRDPRVHFLRHDIFDPLPFKGTLIRIANLLNRIYFSDEDLRRAITVASNNLESGGYLLVTRSDDGGTENGTLFRRGTRQFETAGIVGRGSEITDIISAVTFDPRG